MSFISIAAHQKFIFQCQRLIESACEDGQLIPTDETTKQLKEDLAQLQQLVEAYMYAFSQLPKLSSEYNTLRRRIRVDIRKMQISKMAPMKNK